MWDRRDQRMERSFHPPTSCIGPLLKNTSHLITSHPNESFKANVRARKCNH